MTSAEMDLMVERFEAGYKKGYAEGKHDFEPKHGKWIKEEDEEGKCEWHRCSECHKVCWYIDSCNFCSNCGAIMEVDNEQID